ncbi:hypothetical protein [Sediminibacterium roseum]|nr:hypothetical protein [Sediminibacterium roseum]
MRKYACLLMASLLSAFSIAGAQQLDSMMNRIARHFAPEKIHIHFDKSIYNRGETIWYKAYILQGRDSLPASTNVYLEWYDGDGKPLLRTAAPVLFSSSAGSFDIPADYNFPSLQVKAFTKWMLNDDPAFAYQRDIAVNIPSIKTARPPADGTAVSVFPEGGFLVQGLRSRVAFKANNRSGAPVFVYGVLTDNNNNTLDSLQVQHDGMGSFFLEPVPGQTYRLNWVDEYGTAGSTTLPAAKTQGAQLAVTRIKDKAMFRVERTEVVAEHFKKMTMLVHMNGVGLYQVEINLSDKTVLNAAVPIHDLPPGLLQFTLFTSDWLPAAERVLFLNNPTYSLAAELSAPVVNTAKKGENSLEIFVPDTSFTNMSLSVTDAGLDLPAEHSIFSDLLLSGEIKGRIYNPAYYFSSGADSVAAHLDLVMLTNGWRRFDWEKIKAGVAPKTEHPAETGFMKMNGTVYGTRRNSAPVELNLIVVHKDSSRQFFSVPVTNNGRFEQPLVFFDTATVFYSVNNNKALSEKIELKLDNGLLQLPAKNISPWKGSGFTVKNRPLAKQMLDRLLQEQELLNKLLAETTLKDVTVTTRKKTREEILNEKYASGFFNGSPSRKDYTYDLTDPAKPTVAINVLEYLQGKIPGLTIRYISGLNYSIDWRGYLPEFYLNENKIDLSTLVDIPVASLAMIKAFAPPFVFASGGGRGGAIAVYTRRGTDTQLPDPKGLASVLLPGYTRFREFYSPVYDKQPDDLPKADNRTTLYWNPNLFSNATQQRILVDFYNNDFTQSFNVVLEGICANGKLIRVVKKIGGAQQRTENGKNY